MVRVFRYKKGYFQLGTSLVNTNQQWVGLSLQRKIYRKDLSHCINTKYIFILFTLLFLDIKQFVRKGIIVFEF